MKDRPFLIIISGFPRSGTSWLAKLFDSHPQTLYRHEPDSMEYPRRLPLVIDDCKIKYKNTLYEFISRLPNIRDPKVSASRPVFNKAFFSSRQQLILRTTLQMVKALSYFKITANVPSYCIPKKGDNYVLLWKTIESSGRLKLYADVLHKKRIVHILRHPCGVIASLLRGQRDKKFGGYSPEEDYDLFRIFLSSTGRRRYGITLNSIKKMTPVERLTWGYIFSMERAIEQIDGKSDAKMIVYEDLCERPFEILKNLFDFCQLNFDKQCEEFVQKSTNKKRKGYYSIWKDPIEAAYKWRKELSKSEQCLILEQLQRSSLAKFWHE